MAPPPTISVYSSEPPKLHASNIGSIKTFADANGLSPIPSSYYSIVEARDNVADHLASCIPAIDFSLLTSDLPQLHADAVSQLGKACAELWFFHGKNSSHVINHFLLEDMYK
ncbi:hypothetical protein QN277_018498 [Acacia crassicarpa]|uniref:Uncharacterized protein n=1 Tax=Acacia crassicarpa TaxID=499986 RepID=A0AAE1MUS4_9FABA|nr:hypothetical protein QN277_018498 [Acacia crassicarpa]